MSKMAAYTAGVVGLAFASGSALAQSAVDSRPTTANSSAAFDQEIGSLLRRDQSQLQFDFNSGESEGGTGPGGFVRRCTDSLDPRRFTQNCGP